MYLIVYIIFELQTNPLLPFVYHNIGINEKYIL